MKKTIIIIFTAAVALSACNNASKTENKTEKVSTDSINASNMQVDSALTAAAYACPMHPEVYSNSAGTCSKCGMDLEKK